MYNVGVRFAHILLSFGFGLYLPCKRLIDRRSRTVRRLQLSY